MSHTRIILLLLLLAPYRLIHAQQTVFNNQSVYALGTFKNGALISADNGVYYFTDKLIKLDTDLQHDRVMTFHTAADGICYAGTYNGRLLVISEVNQIKSIRLPLTESGQPCYINSIVSRNGSVWLSSLEGVLFCFDQKENTITSFPVRSSNGKNNQHISGISFDSRGNLWIAAQERLFFHPEEEIKSNSRKIQGSDNYGANFQYIVPSDIGNLAIRTNRFNFLEEISSGTYTKRLQDAHKSVQPIPENLREQTLSAVGADQFGTWFLFNDLYLLHAGSWKKVPVNGIHSIEGISSFALINRVLYIGSDQGLYTFDLGSFIDLRTRQ